MGRFDLARVGQLPECGLRLASFRRSEQRDLFQPDRQRVEMFELSRLIRFDLNLAESRHRCASTGIKQSRQIEDRRRRKYLHCIEAQLADRICARTVGGLIGGDHEPFVAYLFQLRQRTQRRPGFAQPHLLPGGRQPTVFGQNRQQKIQLRFLEESRQRDLV
jgi:hypothetical protein